MAKPHAAFCEDVQRAVAARLPSISTATRVGLLSDIAFLSQSGVEAEVVAAPAPAIPSSAFVLGQRSKDELALVHPKLRQCVELAIGYSTVDFRVNQGMRTVIEQKAAVAAGNSRTMHSKHLKQADGLAWAVDLVVLTGGVVDWTFNKYAAIAYAMDRAATELGIAGHIRWGCAWDRVLSDFGGSDAAYLAEAGAYAKRHVGSDLLDAPHFEWVA
jgi:peptidoglycan L-alanyl-D-glutamate endopeptidase CwlK